MFEDDRFYLTDDPKLTESIAPASTMSKWRMAGRGPAFVRLGRRVRYSGRDLNEWLQEQRVPCDQG